MSQIIEFISQPWPWYVAGPIMAFVMFSLILFGNNFGISANLRTMCTVMGAGRKVAFFNFNWKDQIWNLVFVLGLILGGFIASYFLTSSNDLNVSPATIAELNALGLDTSAGGSNLVPESLFNWQALGTMKGLVLLVGGGFLIGFGARYGGGCTSGHAISGLSELQVPSLIAVIGFFIGGLLVTNFLLPFLLPA